jgi:acylphosphatase
MRHASHLIIRGRVQGVSFRAWAARQDGGVEAILAGEPDAVRQLVEACRVGPQLAVVTDVIELPADTDPGTGFHIRH